jgi:hypothetical protein
MFGGQQAAGYSNSTWAWTGSNWQQLAPATVPGARAVASMAWDPTTSQLIMFGGQQPGAAAAYGDTWAWNGANWVQLHPATSPLARYTASLVFDPATGQMLLVGGRVGAQVVNDVWAWSGRRGPGRRPRKRFRLAPER